MIILHWVNSPKTITELICINFSNRDEFYPPIRVLICDLSQELVIYTFGCICCKIVDLFFSFLFLPIIKAVCHQLMVVGSLPSYKFHVAHHVSLKILANLPLGGSQGTYF